MKSVHKTLATLGASIFAFLSASLSASAQITNPVTGQWGDDPGAAAGGGIFSRFFIYMWNAVITVGAIIVLVYFIWGAIEWLTSSGDKAKLENSRNKMLHAAIGMFLLVTLYTIIGFISTVLFGNDFNILRPVFVIPD